jgi:hypothetical protein
MFLLPVLSSVTEECRLAEKDAPVRGASKNGQFWVTVSWANACLRSPARGWAQHSAGRLQRAALFQEPGVK